MRRSLPVLPAALVWLAVLATPARAHDCSGLFDCFAGNVRPALWLLLGLLLLLGLALVAPVAINVLAGFAARGLLGAALRSRLAAAAARALGRLAGPKLRIALRTAAQPYKGSTRIGHALSKHAGRNPQRWGPISGPQSGWHQQAMRHFREIYRGPGRFRKVTDPKTGLRFIEKRLPDGRGVRLNLDFTFKGFLG